MGAALKTIIRVAAIGECMIELRHIGATQLELAFGGDTFNTSAYLARVGGARIHVDYATALGDDPYSEAMRETFQREGVGTDLVATLPGRLPGLYAIRVDAKGERSFFYWRREAAARSMLEGEAGDRLARALGAQDWIYFSGITLSILAEESRERLFAILDAARRTGTKVAFDTNFRARGWPDLDAARATMSRALRHADLALPTFPDEAALFGDDDPDATIARMAALGVPEIVVKDGSAPVRIESTTGSWRVDCPAVTRIVDTTAAGDAFNAGFIAARIHGAAPDRAAAAGCHLAGIVIGHPGAVIPKAATPALEQFWC